VKQTFLSIIVLFSFTFSVVGQGLPSQPNILTLHTGPLVAQVSNIVTNNDSLDINLVDDNKNIIAKLEAWDSKDVRLDSTLSDKEILAVFDSSNNRYKVNRLYPPKFEIEGSGPYYLSRIITGYNSDTGFVELPESAWRVDSSMMFRKIATISYKYARPADLTFYLGGVYSKYLEDCNGNHLIRLYESRGADSITVYVWDEYERGKHLKLGNFIERFINHHQEVERVLKFLPCPELAYDLLVLNIGYFDGIERLEEETGLVFHDITSRALVMRMDR